MLSNTLLQNYGLSKTSGDVGIEVEMEMSDWFNDELIYSLNNSGWRVHSDGSLKGPSCELVIQSPISKSSVVSKVDDLALTLSKGKANIVESIRAGIHIHMNMQQNTLFEVMKLLACYYPIETVLLRKCGFGRQGNLFCLSARNANFLMHKLCHSLKTNNFSSLNTHDLRYTAFNFQSMFTYGSLEFRAIATQKDLTIIPYWVDVLDRIREFSLGVGDPWEFIEIISGHGGQAYLEKVLGDDLAKDFIYDNLEQDIISDLRNSQAFIKLLSSKV